MGTAIRFTRNYSDHSTEAGYQFEFFCMRCGNGYKSGFDASGIGMGNKLIRGLGGMLGGRLGGASQAGETLADLTGSQAKDRALEKAVQEIAPLFRQCHNCGNWVCHEICWNDEFNQCVSCTPKLEQELGEMQSRRRMDQVQEKVNAADYAAEVNVERIQVALCPHCGAEAAHGAKFCGECGKAMRVAGECARCGTQSPAGTKFCPECGDKL